MFLRRFRKPAPDQDYMNEFVAYLDGKRRTLSRHLYEVLTESPGSYRFIDRIRGLRKRVPQTDWQEILNLQVAGLGYGHVGISGVLRGQTLSVTYTDRDMPYNYHIFQFTLNGVEFPGRYQLLPIINMVRDAAWTEKNIQKILDGYRRKQEESKRRREEAEALKRPFKDLLAV